MWGGITSEIILGAGFLLICAVCAVCIVANVVTRIGRQSAREDEADQRPNGDWPFLRPEQMTSFHSASVAQEEQPGRV